MTKMSLDNQRLLNVMSRPQKIAVINGVGFHNQEEFERWVDAGLYSDADVLDMFEQLLKLQNIKVPPKPLLKGLRKLSSKQATVLEVIDTCNKQNGYSPTVREIAKLLELSPSVVQGHINQLYKKSYIERIGPRAIKVIGMVEGSE
ncbi:LexA family transcriptional regulator [Paenibacillus sp. L3-i20]|uniref:LexA family protein n=1 Tax=Paenibacillus sp. L3-i20 TaxID=2905833 RepID=UPI0020BE5239|nr:hypothetical protein [Paenibacillus sp. L3-i20]